MRYTVLKIQVEIYSCTDHKTLIHSYTMDHDDADQRRVLGAQCRGAFEAGQKVVTYPKHK